MTYSPLLNASAYLYHVSVQEKIQNLCASLPSIGITHFHYMKIFKTGYYLHLTNNYPFLKELYETLTEVGIFFTDQLTKVLPYKNYYILKEDLKKFDGSQDPLMNLHYRHGEKNCFVICKLSPLGYMECYFFSAYPPTLVSSQFYLNNLDVLEKFCETFNEKASELIDCTQTSKCALLNQTFYFQSDLEEEILLRRIEFFLEKESLKNECAHTDLFSKHTGVDQKTRLKELEYLLNLSIPTLEFYLKNAPSRQEEEQEMLLSWIPKSIHSGKNRHEIKHS